MYEIVAKSTRVSTTFVPDCLKYDSMFLSLSFDAADFCAMKLLYGQNC